MNQMTSEAKEELESLVREIMAGYEARGIALGVIDRNGKILYENYFGWRDAEKRLPVDRETIFGMASVTKSFTALSIMQMQRDGILNIEDPVSEYVPEFSDDNQSEKVRIWHLMCHSGGYFPLPRIVVDQTAKEMGISDSLENELIQRQDFADEGVRRVALRLSSQTNFTGRPGQYFSYCNDGFGILSDIVRRHSGEGSFSDYLTKRILEPVGMERSNISFIRNSLDENAAILYSKEGDGVWRGDRDYQNDAFVLHGGGGLKSTLGDMLKYGAMYLNEGCGLNGNVVIDRSSIMEMCRPRQEVKPGVYYGFGLEIKQLGDMAVIEHGGSLPGVSSNFSFCTQAGLAVVVLCNTMDVPVYAIADGAMRAFCGMAVREEKLKHMPARWEEWEIAQLEGEYKSGEGDAFCLVRDREKGLKMELNGKENELLPLYPWQGIVRRKYTDIYLTAIRDAGGKVFAARFGSRIFPKVSV